MPDLREQFLGTAILPLPDCRAVVKEETGNRFTIDTRYLEHYRSVALRELRQVWADVNRPGWRLRMTCEDVPF